MIFLQIKIFFLNLQRVFHSIRFKVNKGWSTAVLLFLCLEVKGIVDMVFIVAIVYSGYSLYSGCLFLLFYHFAIKILKSVAKNKYFC